MRPHARTAASLLLTCGTTTGVATMRTSSSAPIAGNASGPSSSSGACVSHTAWSSHESSRQFRSVRGLPRMRQAAGPRELPRRGLLSVQRAARRQSWPCSARHMHVRRMRPTTDWVHPPGAKSMTPPTCLRASACVKRWQKRYAKNLRARVLSVSCPACGARKGLGCIGRNGRLQAGTHIDRHDAARRAGVVCGRRAWMKGASK
jgi:hypothetical protein